MSLKRLLWKRNYQEWFSSLPVFLLLLTVVMAGNGEKLHGRLLQLGEFLWQDYFLLRTDIKVPECNPDVDIDQELDRLEKEAASSDEMAIFFEPTPFDRKAAHISLERNRALCVEKHRVAQRNRAKVTLPVVVFRSVETAVAALSKMAVKNQATLLIALIFICAATSTCKHRHIAFKPVLTPLDQRVSGLAQLLGNGMLLVSTWTYRASAYASATEVAHPQTYLMLLFGFASLCVINVYQVVSAGQDREKKHNVLESLQTIPLYIFMSVIAGGYFFLVERHCPGLSIFFSLLFDQAGLFLNIGLYIWAGMLLKQTRVGFLVFKAFNPWRMSPELLAFAAVLVLAVPTAYTGASGIIIIAMGSIAYKELRRAGARRQLALAATAISGSAGVVLRPCLLVVLIAALNKEVVTDQLFAWGINVFATNLLVFLMFVRMTSQQKMSMAPVSEALKPFLKALTRLIPYAVILLLVTLVYDYFLDIRMDEFSAPIILPMIIMVVIVYEKFTGWRSLRPHFEKPWPAIEQTIRGASSESSVHIGALLLLIGLSFASGGVIDRSGVLANVPEMFQSPWLTLSFLVVVLLGIGMVMDPFGAVVLVSGTIAQIAYKNGIDPVHFWMITLVAFELGYLTPPVALNHLLTRQVVGSREVSQARLEGSTFWYRHEKYLLPIVTMGTTLILVAFMPVLVGDVYPS